MTYITQQDLEDELGLAKLIQLTDDTQSREVGTSRVGKAIAYAEGTFDAYARVRYTIPVTVTPMVKATCLDLAVFHLFKSRVTSEDGVYKIRKDAHDQALSFLQRVNKGQAALDVPSAQETETNPGSPDKVLSGTRNPVFTDDNLSSF